jgi:hypothetical protein
VTKFNADKCAYGLLSLLIASKSSVRVRSILYL